MKKQERRVVALFGETIVEEITELVRQRHGELGRALGRPARQEHPDQRDAQSPLRHDLNLLIRVANGEYSRAKATPATVRRVELALQRLLDLLLGNALHTNITIPDDFWPTQI